MESTERRLPVYLLLDCSESMIGDGIDGVNAGMRQLLLDLHSDPHALEPCGFRSSRSPEPRSKFCRSPK